VKIQVPPAEELDAQSPVKVDEWLEIGSIKFHKIVGDIGTFNCFIRMGFHDPPFLFRDELARVWIKGSDKWTPLNDVVGGKTYGYKYASAAKN
jgi:hypothetical protein